jgi:cell shape-determining protein MreC
MMMVWNYQHPAPSQLWREKLSFVTTPILYIVHLPVALIDDIATNFQGHKFLVKENTILREKLMIAFVLY